MKTQNVIVAMALAGAMSGCAAATPSPQLAQAREAHATSSQGLAAQLTPTELYEAKKVLDRANAEFAENGDTVESRDLAYIAHRKLELADARARTEVDRLTIAGAVKAGVVVRDSQVKHSEAALASTRKLLREERRDASAAANEARVASTAQGKELEVTVGQLEAEIQARLSAEGKLAGAMKDLATVAAVKEEPRGVVITLSGSILFASGKYALLNTAMTKLDQVAEALKAQDAGQADDRRGPHRQPGVGRHQPAALGQPGQRGPRLPRRPRGGLGEDHRSGDGLQPVDRRQQDRGEPGQQPPGGDRHRRRQGQHAVELPRPRRLLPTKAAGEQLFRAPGRNPDFFVSHGKRATDCNTDSFSPLAAPARLCAPSR